MRLLFEDLDCGVRTFICQVKDESEAAQEIGKYITENFVSKKHHVRQWKNDRGDIIYDYGSYSKFFILQL